ncbi:hypothetical protein GALL_517100 [mine drainage metagenome]|uniref:Uncharacterized protein n=1 Tax=mine drainage metagenome TaxID=410659 RepID=A0A1J5P7I2_9ZZZZ
MNPQPIDTLFDDAVGLFHLFHAHQVTVIGITRVPYRNVKIKAVINLIGLLLPQIPGNA